MLDKVQDTANHIGVLYAALAAAQSEITDPEKTKTGKVSGVSKAGNKYDYEFKYADISDVLKIVREVFSKHDLAVTQPTKIVDGTIVLVTRVAHNSGHTIESEYPVCSLNGNHQAMGSAMTYARRYALTSLVGIAAVDDTDGAGAAESGEGERVKMSSAQAQKEINWADIQAAIDGSKDFKALDRHEQTVEQRKGVWPDTYYWKAKERVEFNRLAMADARLKEITDLDKLNDEFAQIEGALDGKVSADELLAKHRANETRIMHGADNVR